jgi:hypothetical protein
MGGRAGARCGPRVQALCAPARENQWALWQTLTPSTHVRARGARTRKRCVSQEAILLSQANCCRPRQVARSVLWCSHGAAQPLAQADAPRSVVGLCMHSGGAPLSFAVRHLDLRNP